MTILRLAGELPAGLIFPDGTAGHSTDGRHVLRQPPGDWSVTSARIGLPRPQPAKQTKANEENAQMIKVGHIALAGAFATSMFLAPAAFAQSGTTSNGGAASTNAGSSSNKADKKMQSNAMSANKKKQHK